MLLVDKEIRRLLERDSIKIESSQQLLPFDAEIQVGPASVDLRLGEPLLRVLGEGKSERLIFEDDRVTIPPGALVITETLEAVGLPASIAAFLTGRRTFAEMGLMVECCQNLVHPGYAGTIPLQLVNMSPTPVSIPRAERVCQLVLYRTSADAERPYFLTPEAQYRSDVPEPQKPEFLDWMTTHLEPRLRKLETSRSRGHSREATDLLDMLRAYVGSPTSADAAERTSFREDTVFTTIGQLLEKLGGSRPLNVLDACCGSGSWVKLASASLNGTERFIEYVGIDRDSSQVELLRASADSFKHGFARFRCLTRNVDDLKGVSEVPFDLIVLSNSLHEICPALFGAMLTQFADCLSPAGILLIVDMERLPFESPEACAITWSGDEAESLLQEFGFSTQRTAHKKQVPVYRINATTPPKAPDLSAFNARLARILTQKLSRAVQGRPTTLSSASSADELMQWVVSAGTIARYVEAIMRLGKFREPERQTLC